MIAPRKIDAYITKKFMLTFFISLVLIIGIVIIFDISEKIDKFVTNHATLHEVIFDYYVNFIPYFINMFSPLFVFLTVIFFTSRLAANSEIIAILSCGISYHRLLRPYLFSAGIIALLSLLLNLYIIPGANKDRLAFENQYVKNRETTVRNVHYQIAPGTFVYVETFSPWNNTAYHMTIEDIENNRIVSKLSAESAAWDSTSGAWKLKKYFIRDYSEGLADNVRFGDAKDTVIALTKLDFYRNQQTVQTLPHGQLQGLIKTQKMRGDSNIIYAQIEMHTRFALPFSAFILTIMGLALSSKKKRGGIGLNLAVGIALSFSYILFLRFSQMFVFTGLLPPGIALWVPNVLFAAIAAFLYKIAPK